MTKQLTQHLEMVRQLHGRSVDVVQRSALGQFLTPMPLAEYMAALLRPTRDCVRLLDPGAGAGALLAAAVMELSVRRAPPRELHITAYELDPALTAPLKQTLEYCGEFAAARGVAFSSELIAGDFILAAAAQLQNQVFGDAFDRYDVVIMNPPYRKIGAQSVYVQVLNSVGVMTTNLYTGFLALAVQMLEENGQIVGITPRSFCNGSYFRAFRHFFLERMIIEEIHLFDSRQAAFADDQVLQENLITVARRSNDKQADVAVATSEYPGATRSVRNVPAIQLLPPDDPERMIHLPLDEQDAQLALVMRGMPCSLSQLGLTVSTGPVVDFRLATHLRMEPGDGTVPLLYPVHLNGGITWPKMSKKPNSIVLNEVTRGWLVPRGTYVLVKRISAKEEPRRVVATVLNEQDLPGSVFGFENHLNYFHCNKRGLEPDIARGLAAYLNSTLVDRYMRHFNGHTQVNATDLRVLRYPTNEDLIWIGKQMKDNDLSIERIDACIEEILK
jgi:adenine-specific DNA-methyltransferase